jgi:hypothetical protein
VAVRQKNQLEAFNLYSSGHRLCDIATQLKVSETSAWSLIDQAMTDYRERIAESVERWIALEWARLQRQEEGLWRNIRLAETAALTEEGEINFGAIAALYGRLSGLNKDRLALLEKVDPGIDQSLDTAVSFVVVANREQLPPVIDAVNFAQRVVHDIPSEELEEQQPIDDQTGSS